MVSKRSQKSTREARVAKSQRATLRQAAHSHMATAAALMMFVDRCAGEGVDVVELGQAMIDDLQQRAHDELTLAKSLEKRRGRKKQDPGVAPEDPDQDFIQQLITRAAAHCRRRRQLPTRKLAADHWFAIDEKTVTARLRRAGLSGWTAFATACESFLPA